MITNRDELQDTMSEIDMRRMDQSTLEQNAYDGVMGYLDKLTDDEFIVHLEEYFPKLKQEVINNE